MSLHINNMINLDLNDEEKKVIDDIKRRLREGREPINSEIDELQYSKKPIGRSIYQCALQEKKNTRSKRGTYKPDDKVICDLCGKQYRRSNRSFHERTKHHLTYKLVNDKFKQLILN